MNNILLKDMLYLSLIICIILLSLVVSFRISIYRLRQKNYFLNRDRERYAETMYASKDGYFAFVYPDEHIKDPRKSIRERCSRRLAVMLNLKNGINSNFEDITNSFYKEDAKKLKKYLKLMQEEGITFEDTFTLKNTNRKMSVYGARINAYDGNLYCDMLWFRDLSEEMIKIEALNVEKNISDSKLETLQNLIDNLNYPVWIRDDTLNIVAINKKYAEFTGQPNKTEIISNQSEFIGVGINNTDTTTAKDLAKLAQQTNKQQKQNINLVVNGQACNFEIIETPFHHEGDLNKISTVGSLYDMTELDIAKRTFKIHQTAHLEVLSTLGTAFAIFDTDQKLIFNNKSFLNLWNLPPDFTSSSPTYSEYIEKIRNLRMLPEVSDFKTYKNNELNLFNTLIESKNDLLHLPDGRTIKRVVSVHPNGLVFAYEDVSDRLAATRTINELLSVQQHILNNITDAVLIFGTDRKLKYYNNSYINLWNADSIKMQEMHNLEDIIQMQNTFFTNQENWEALKQNMLTHILNKCSRFKIERNDNKIIEVCPNILPDESLMITYLIK